MGGNIVGGNPVEVTPYLSLGCFFFFFFSFFFFFFNQIVIMFKGTKDSCSVSYGDKKPISKRHPARYTSSWEKSNTPNP